LYNEVPDRLSDSAVLIGVGYAAGGGPALGYVAALLAVLTAYVRALGRGAGRPQDFRGPMAKQQRMFLVTLLGFWMAAVPTGWAAWRLDPQGLSMGVPAMVLAVVALGCVVTCWRRLATLAASLRSEA
jgi:phosphatidylglycerophosphate synthase